MAETARRCGQRAGEGEGHEVVARVWAFEAGGEGAAEPEPLIVLRVTQHKDGKPATPCGSTQGFPDQGRSNSIALLLGEDRHGSQSQHRERRDHARHEYVPDNPAFFRRHKRNYHIPIILKSADE